jgi:hypothetical protein
MKICGMNLQRVTYSSALVTLLDDVVKPVLAAEHVQVEE